MKLQNIFISACLIVKLCSSDVQAQKQDNELYAPDLLGINVSATTADFTLTVGEKAVYLLVHYKPVHENNWNEQLLAAGNTLLLRNLLASTNYDVQIMAVYPGWAHSKALEFCISTDKKEIVAQAH
jgi:hypothetical protein